MQVHLRSKHLDLHRKSRLFLLTLTNKAYNRNDKLGIVEVTVAKRELIMNVVDGQNHPGRPLNTVLYLGWITEAFSIFKPIGGTWGALLIVFGLFGRLIDAIIVNGFPTSPLLFVVIFNVLYIPLEVAILSFLALQQIMHLLPTESTQPNPMRIALEPSVCFSA